MGTLAIIKNTIITIFLTCLFSVLIQAQNVSCNIYDLEVYDIECSSDSTYLVSIDFLFDSVSQGLFTLKDRNGVVGNFEYDSLPIRVELSISGSDYELVRVEDLNAPDCFDLREFMVDCSSACEIFDLTFSNIECTSDSTYLVTIDFEYSNVTNNFFDLSDRNGILGFFAYDSLPIRTEVPISGLDYEFLEVSDNDNPDCSAAGEFMVDCSPGCNISNLKAIDRECSSDSTYWVTIDFDHSMALGDSFELFDRTGLIGKYSYANIPLRIELSISQNQYQLIKFRDILDPTCMSEIEFFQSCHCLLNLHYFNTECTSDSTYEISIDVHRQNVFGDSFRIDGMDTTYGSFTYDSLPIRIEAKLINNNYQYLTAKDLLDTTCSVSLEFMLDCLGEDSCGIYNLSASNVECASDSSYYVTLDFDYDSLPDDFLVINNSNGYVRSIHVDSIPIRLEIPLTSADPEFIEVSDWWRLSCSDKVEIDLNCMDSFCQIENLEFTNIECTSDSTYLVTIDFEYSNVTNNFFDLSDRNGILEFFAYDSLPIRTEVPISGLDYEFLEVSDNDNPDCSAAAEFMVNCNTECEIFNLTFSNIECVSDSTYLVTIDFEYSNVTNNFFDLSDRNGILEFFAYDSLPIRTEVPISGLDYEFLKISDNDNMDCYAAEEFMLECTSSQNDALEQKNFTVWPNPATHILNLHSGQRIQYLLYSSSGQAMMKGMASTSTQLDISGLPSGIYFLQIISNNNHSQYKIIKM